MKKSTFSLLAILFLAGCELFEDPAPTTRIEDICGLHNASFTWSQTENELVKLTVREAEAGNYKLTIDDTGDPDCQGEIKIIVRVDTNLISNVTISSFPFDIDFSVASNFTQVEIDAETISKNCNDPAQTGAGTGILSTKLTCTFKKI